MKSLENKIIGMKGNLRKKMAEIATGKKEGDGQVVVAVLLIVVAVILVFLFKDKITALMTSVFSTVDTKLTTLLGTI